MHTPNGSTTERYRSPGGHDRSADLRYLNIVLPALEQIHAPSRPEDAYIDIVAVHGILGDTTNAWTIQPDQNNSNPESWLVKRDMLPQAVPNARVWQYRYHVPQPMSKDFTDHLQRTSDRLTQLLTEKVLIVRHRPIIFLAHGYGGLVVLRTLLSQPVSIRTIAVGCFAVPFRLVQRCSALPGAPTPSDEAVVEQLATLLQEFRRAPNSRNLLIRCFYETQPDGEDRKIVPLRSASLADDNAGPSVLALETTYYRITRFNDPNDSNYELVSDVIQGWVNRAYPEVITQAILKGQDDMATNLIEEHRRSLATNERITPALEAAVKQSKRVILSHLLSHGINVNAFVNSNRETALMLAVRARHEDDAEIVRLLLEKGAVVGVKNAEGHSAIEIAQAQPHPDIEPSKAIIQLLQDIPPLRGPAVSRKSVVGQRLKNPELHVNDFKALDHVHTRIADVYEVDGRERTFIRSPSVRSLIYEHGPRHLMNREVSRWSGHGLKRFRWLHLPANNITWVKDLIQRCYKERPTPNGNSDEAIFFEKCEYLTDRRFWEGQVCISPLASLTHLRYMTPQVKKVEYLTELGATKELGTTGVILFMPYLHYEVSPQRKKMAEAIREVRETHSQQPRNPDDLLADQKLIWAYLREDKDMPLHCRRTLDQFYYDALDSDRIQNPERKASGLHARNRDQVVQKYMEKKWGKPTNMLMVDQLWMVLLENGKLDRSRQTKGYLLTPIKTLSSHRFLNAGSRLDLPNPIAF
jgi:pimeloyl-ACP methyl ester carboxylesterase